MTHIQSIFDLSYDIQHMIGEELKPRLQSKKNMRRAIRQNKSMMNTYDLLNIEDFEFGRGRFQTKYHTGRMLLLLVKKYKEERAEGHDYYQYQYMEMSKALICMGDMCKKDANKLFNRMKTMAYLRLYRTIIDKIPVNIYGFLHLSGYDVRGNCITQRRNPRPHHITIFDNYTHAELTAFGQENGIKMAKSWDKRKKITHLMKTEV